MQVTLCDVGPRDGLQNEPETLAPAVRAELVSRLAAAIPGAEVLEADGAGHDIHHSHSEWLVQTVLNWVGKY